MLMSFLIMQETKLILIMSQSEVHKGRFDLQAPSAKDAATWAELIRKYANNLATHIVRMGPLKKRQCTRPNTQTHSGLVSKSLTRHTRTYRGLLRWVLRYYVLLPNALVSYESEKVRRSVVAKTS
jgi:exoribonuclease II